jgi:hypothetical protein
MQSMRNEIMSRMESMETRIGVRLDQLDRDVRFLMRREFGDQ